MTSKTISFNTQGHDGLIDFIKAYAIICVLIGHSIPDVYLDNLAYGVWAGMQVPLFILIQSFHFYKKEGASFHLEKLLKRILIPFVFVEIIIFLFFALWTRNPLPLLWDMIKVGGYGPGAYFPWIYIQIAILLPLSSLIFKRISSEFYVIIAIIVAEGFEVALSYCHISEDIYRLLSIRYIFLLFLGWVWERQGIVLNKWTVILSVLSLISIIYFEYYSINDEPLFYSTSWKYHRWPCYFFVANLGGGCFKCFIQ